MVSTITRGRQRALPASGKVLPDDLTEDYRALWLVLTACVLTTTCVVGLMIEQMRFLYAVGVGRWVCLARIYMILAVRAMATTKMTHIKGTRVLQALADKAKVPREDGDEVVTGQEGLVTPSIATRSTAKRGARARRAQGEAEKQPRQRRRVGGDELGDISQWLARVARRMLEVIIKRMGVDPPGPIQEEEEARVANASEAVGAGGGDEEGPVVTGMVLRRPVSRIWV